MTKQQELDKLRALGQELGPNSYLGPAIAHAMTDVDRALRCDLIPNMGERLCQLKELHDIQRDDCDRQQAVLAELNRQIAELKRQVEMERATLRNLAQQQRDIRAKLERAIGII